MGLTQTALSALSGLSRATVNQVENGTINDLSLTRTARLLGVLGLTLSVTPARPKSNAGSRPKTSPLILAARTASVSYRDSLMPELLEHVLLSGEGPLLMAARTRAFPARSRAFCTSRTVRRRA
jgi:transcriptional regulator with XRE-family HTH domain